MCRREEKHTTASSARSGAEDTEEDHRMQEHWGADLRRIAHFFFFLFAEPGRKHWSLRNVKGRKRVCARVCLHSCVCAAASRRQRRGSAVLEGSHAESSLQPKRPPRQPWIRCGEAKEEERAVCCQLDTSLITPLFNSLMLPLSSLPFNDR